MSEATKPSVVKGSDWTRLLTDPDLASHLGQLLQTYREVAPELRESALLKAMREIKEAAVNSRQSVEPSRAAAVTAPLSPTVLPRPEAVETTPPFEPAGPTASASGGTKWDSGASDTADVAVQEPESDLFAPQTGLGRRRYHRLKCFVAVEIHLDGNETPIWGNLANVSRGGCMVETVSPVPPGKNLQIGLWVANGKLWVKGVVLSGVATRTAPSFGVRVKFSETELAEKEHLREFLKFVESTTRKSHSGNAYVAKLKG